MALPAYLYRDPAEVVERAELNEMGCTLCQHAAATMVGTFCNHANNPLQKGFPWKGYRCRLFESVDEVQS